MGCADSGETQNPRPPRLETLTGRSATEQVKLMLMRGIDAKVAANYATLSEASNELGIQLERLSRIRHGHCERFSIEWLVGTAYRLDVGITLKVGD